MKGTLDVVSFSACVCQPDKHDAEHRGLASIEHVTIELARS